MVGWMLSTVGIGSPLAGLVAAFANGLEAGQTSRSLGPFLFAALVIDNSGWLLLIFPIFHLMLVFPTGKILSPRWRWLVGLEAVMVVSFVLLLAFSERLGPLEGEWRVANPIGFISESFWDTTFMIPWSAGLLVLTIGGVAAMVVRYRHSAGDQRQQMKWVLYAVGLFGAVYGAAAINQGGVTGGM
jgi:hypothetical protein